MRGKRFKTITEIEVTVNEYDTISQNMNPENPQNYYRHKPEDTLEKIELERSAAYAWEKLKSGRLRFDQLEESIGDPKEFRKVLAQEAEYVAKMDKAIDEGTLSKGDMIGLIAEGLFHDAAAHRIIFPHLSAADKTILHDDTENHIDEVIAFESEEDETEFRMGFDITAGRDDLLEKKKERIEAMLESSKLPHIDYYVDDDTDMPAFLVFISYNEISEIAPKWRTEGIEKLADIPLWQKIVKQVQQQAHLYAEHAEKNKYAVGARAYRAAEKYLV